MEKRPPTCATFDFEIGNLLESPCKRCHKQALLPKCAANCKLIDDVQKILAGGISSVKNFSPAESFTILISE
jgi:hypothetical protein